MPREDHALQRRDPDQYREHHRIDRPAGHGTAREHEVSAPSAMPPTKWSDRLSSSARARRSANDDQARNAAPET
jgi:hypothetical protein